MSEEKRKISEQSELLHKKIEEAKKEVELYEKQKKLGEVIGSTLCVVMSIYCIYHCAVDIKDIYVKDISILQKVFGNVVLAVILLISSVLLSISSTTLYRNR